MNKTLKNILLVLLIGFAAYAVFAMYSAFKAGEKTIANLLLAPFKMFSSVIAAVTGIFSGSPKINRPTGNTPGDDLVNSWLDNAMTDLPTSNAPKVDTVFGIRAPLKGEANIPGVLY